MLSVIVHRYDYSKTRQRSYCERALEDVRSQLDETGA